MESQEPNMGYGPLPGGYPNAAPSAAKKKKLALIFVGVAVFIVLSAVLLILGNRQDLTKEVLVNLAVAQNELLRISDEHGKSLKGQAAKNHNAELHATLTSNSLKLTEELRRGYKLKSISSSQQRAAIDEAADERLLSSARLDRLDEDYTEVANQKLGEQLELIQQAQGAVKSKQTKEVLAEISESTTELEKRFSKSQQ